MSALSKGNVEMAFETAAKVDPKEVLIRKRAEILPEKINTDAGERLYLI